MHIPMISHCTPPNRSWFPPLQVLDFLGSQKPGRSMSQDKFHVAQGNSNVRSLSWISEGWNMFQLDAVVIETSQETRNNFHCWSGFAFSLAQWDIESTYYVIYIVNIMKPPCIKSNGNDVATVKRKVQLRNNSMWFAFKDQFFLPDWPLAPEREWYQEPCLALSPLHCRCWSAGQSSQVPQPMGQALGFLEASARAALRWSAWWRFCQTWGWLGKVLKSMGQCCKIRYYQVDWRPSDLASKSCTNCLHSGPLMISSACPGYSLTPIWNYVDVCWLICQWCCKSACKKCSWHLGCENEPGC